MADFAGILSGYGQAARERNLLDLQMNIQKQDKLAKAYEHFASLPDIPDDLRQEFMTRGMRVLQAPPGKIPKDLADLTPFVTDYLTKQTGKQEGIRREVAARPSFEVQPMAPPPGMPGVPSPQMTAPPMQFPGAQPTEDEAAFLKRSSIFRSPEEFMLEKRRGLESEARAKATVGQEFDEAERRKRIQEATAAGLKDPRDILNYVNTRTLPQPKQGADRRTQKISVNGKDVLALFDPETSRFFDLAGKQIQPDMIGPPTDTPTEKSGPFERLYAAKKKELGRDLTSAEIEALNKQLERQEAKGAFTVLQSPTGEITGAWNPTTDVFKPPPGEGLRRSPLPAGENLRRATATVMIQDIDTLAQLMEKNKDVIGPIRGRLTELKRGTVGVPEDVNSILRISGNLKDQLLRARSGAQINEQEYARLAKLVPDANQPLSVFISNMKRFRSEVDRTFKYSTGGLTPPPSGGSAAPQVGETFQGKRILKVEKVQ